MEIRDQVLNRVNMNSLPAFKQVEKASLPQVKNEEYQLDSRIAFANYNIANAHLLKNIDVQPLVPTIILPEAIDAIEGERIYKSDGTLHSIVNENDKTKTTYLFSKDYENMITSIKTVDKETNNVVFDQYNEIEDGIYKETVVTKNNPKTGKEEAHTYYENGKPVWASKTIQNKKGVETYITRDFEHGGYDITENQENKFGSKYSYISISEDRKNIRYSEEFVTNKGEVRKNVEFYNGALISVEQSTYKNMPNLLSFDPLNDEDLLPAPHFDVKEFSKEALNEDGVNTYYSNGAVETKILNDGIVASFSPDNKLEKFEGYDGIVEIFDSSYKVTQMLENGAKKTTFRSDSIVTVEYELDGFKKELAIDNKTKKPLSYHETKMVDGEERNVKTYWFNKNGQVKYAR